MGKSPAIQRQREGYMQAAARARANLKWMLERYDCLNQEIEQRLEQKRNAQKEASRSVREALEETARFLKGRGAWSGDRERFDISKVMYVHHRKPIESLSGELTDREIDLKVRFISEILMARLRYLEDMTEIPKTWKNVTGQIMDAKSRLSVAENQLSEPLLRFEPKKIAAAAISMAAFTAITYYSAAEKTRHLTESLIKAGSIVCAILLVTVTTIPYLIERRRSLALISKCEEPVLETEYQAEELSILASADDASRKIGKCLEGCVEGVERFRKELANIARRKSAETDDNASGLVVKKSACE